MSGCHLNDVLHIHVIPVTPQQKPARGMAKYAHERFSIAFRILFSISALFIVKLEWIEPTTKSTLRVSSHHNRDCVRQYVTLYAFEQTEIVVLVVQAIYLIPLFAECIDLEAARVSSSLAVIGDPHIRESYLFCGFDDLLQCVNSVAQVRVHVEGALQILELYQVRQCASLAASISPHVLPEFRGNIGKAEMLVNLRLSAKDNRVTVGK